MHAAMVSQYESMRLFLRRGGASVNTTDMRNMTALMYASKGGFVNCVNLLLSAQELL